MYASSSKLSIRTRRGFVLPTAAVLFIVGIPIAGLVIDVGVFYMVQSRLQAAVDAGSLAGARALARGDNSTAQIANAQTTAQAYVNANYPGGYLASTNLSVPLPTVSVNNFTRTVTVNGAVDAPHLFMRWFGGTLTTVRASAVATRRDVNIMLVMDRSGSLANSGSCGPLKAAAVDFVNKFSEGRDYVGLSTFATTASVVNAMSQTFKVNVTNSINAIVCQGATSSPSGLWLGYQSLAALQQPDSLNVILFFTDGMPTALAANFAILPASTCTDHSNRIGVLTADRNGNNTVRGLMKHTPGNGELYPAPLSAGCHYYVDSPGWSGSRQFMGLDVTGIPANDIFGNDLTFNYLPVTSSGGLLPATSNYANQENFVNAAHNATVNAAVRIRQPDVPGNGFPALPNVVIFGIGLGGIGAAPDDLMEYVANDPVNPAHFDPTKPPGLYVLANNASELANAFNRIASEILRLAQ
jgi:Flp pilus assembly protein TadG